MRRGQRHPHSAFFISAVFLLFSMASSVPSAYAGPGDDEEAQIRLLFGIEEEFRPLAMKMSPIVTASVVGAGWYFIPDIMGAMTGNVLAL